MQKLLARLNLRQNWPLWVAYCSLSLTLIYIVSLFVFTPYRAFIIYPLLYLDAFMLPVAGLLTSILLALLLGFHNSPDGDAHGCGLTLFAFVFLGGAALLMSRQALSGLCGLVALVAIVALFLAIVIFQRKDNPILKHALKVLFATTGFFGCIVVLHVFSASSFRHIDKAQANGRIYQLAAIIEEESGCVFATYLVYGCDFTGVICNSAQEVKAVGGCTMDLKDLTAARLVVDRNAIYLQTGDEKTLVAQ